MSRLFDVPAGRVDVVANGVDDRAWRARPHAVASARARFAGRGPLIGYAGRLVYEKGVQHLVDAVPHLADRHPGLRVVIAGDGPYRDELVGRAHRLRLGDTVRFAGFLDATQLPAVLAATDATVIPSLYEPFGMIALEAAAAGAPLAVARTGGLAEIVESGVTGVTFPQATRTRWPAPSRAARRRGLRPPGGPQGPRHGDPAVRLVGHRGPHRRQLRRRPPGTPRSRRAGRALLAAAGRHRHSGRKPAGRRGRAEAYPRWADLARLARSDGGITGTAEQVIARSSRGHDLASLLVTAVTIGQTRVDLSTTTAEETRVRVLMVEDDLRVASRARQRAAPPGLRWSSRPRPWRRRPRRARSTSSCSTSTCLTGTVWSCAGRSAGTTSTYIAIIAVTARSEERDRVAGLRQGADDYVVKPFSMAELQARIEAVMRRTARAARIEETLELGELRINISARRVWLSDREVSLTRKEFDLLMALARQAGTVVSRERLLMDIWQTTWKAGHTLDVHVAALRAKLADAGLVETVRGVGYGYGRAKSGAGNSQIILKKSRPVGRTTGLTCAVDTVSSPVWSFHERQTDDHFLRPARRDPRGGGCAHANAYAQPAGVAVQAEPNQVLNLSVVQADGYATLAWRPGRRRHRLPDRADRRRR